MSQKFAAKVLTFYKMGNTRFTEYLHAIYLQIWIAVCTYLLLALTKKKMHMNQSLHTISKNVGLFLTDKTPINELFNKTVPEKESTDYYMPSLFGPEDF